MELERRWEVTLSDIPIDETTKVLHISQTYANFNPDVRIRETKQDDGVCDYTHTVKYFYSNNQREELEQDITKKQYNNIFNFIDKEPVIKDRSLINLDGGLVAEIDDFKDTNKLIVEVEFLDEGQMNEFSVPLWFGKEITEKKSYSKTLFNYINNIDDIDMSSNLDFLISKIK
jgi:CYTH domain-containing protein